MSVGRILRPAAVLFDMDGTLVDSDAAVERAWRTWALEWALDPDGATAVGHGYPAEDTVGRLLPHLDAEEAAGAGRRQLELQYTDLDDVVAAPGAKELTELLDGAGIPWAVVTSADGTLAAARLAAADLRPAVLVTVDDVQRGKPDPEGYQLAAQRLGVDVSRCLVIEDSEPGLAAGRAAGATTVALQGLEGDHPVPDLVAVHPMMVGAIDEVEEVRARIYEALAGSGQLPTQDRLVEAVGSASRLAHAIESLADQRHLVLDATGEVVLAHPFATRSFGFSVMSADTLWWGGCAWDSFALPHLVRRVDDVLVGTRCPACDRPLAWIVDRRAPPPGEEIAHFLVPASRMWDDVVHTCSNQLLFCGHDCVDRWLDRHQLPEGYRMDLETLWRFAAHWYDGRLERGYRRRHPAHAKDYLRSVGLNGPFWGL